MHVLTDPMDIIDPADQDRISAYVRGRWGFLRLTEEEIAKRVDSEARDFAQVLRGGGDFASWLFAGLEVLGDDGLAVYPHGFSPRSRYASRKNRSDLEEAVACALEDEEDPVPPEMREVTDAWVGQSSYEIFVRVRLLEETLADEARDAALAWIEGDNFSMRERAEEAWSKIVGAWYDDRQKSEDDRVMNGALSI